MDKAICMPQKFQRFIAGFYCKEKITLPLVNNLRVCGNIEVADCGKFGAYIGDLKKAGQAAPADGP